MSIVIPRIIHRVWLGVDPMPATFEAYGESWERHHPDWRMRLWGDTEVASLDLSDTLRRARNPAEASDVIRYEVLRREGGVYVDTDVECLRSIESLIDEVEAFAGYETPGQVGSAVSGFVPEHPLLVRATAEIRERVGHGRQSLATGPKLLTELLHGSSEVVLFPSETFYPYHWTERHRAKDHFPNSYAVHHWASSWFGRERLLAEIGDLQRQLHKASGRVAKAEARQAKVVERLRHVEEELAALKASRWWRLGQAPRSLLRRRPRQSSIAAE